MQLRTPDIASCSVGAMHLHKAIRPHGISRRAGRRGGGGGAVRPARGPLWGGAGTARRGGGGRCGAIPRYAVAAVLHRVPHAPRGPPPIRPQTLTSIRYSVSRR